MNNFNFWQKFLLIVSGILTLMGLFISLFNQTSLFDILFNKNINPSFFNDNSISSNFIQFQSWIYGVLGATIFGWGIFIFFITNNAFKNKQKWAWNCIMIGICSWYFIDTSISVYFNIIFNVFFNTVLLLAVLVPLLFTKKYFLKNINTNNF